jgi:NADH dehydrogenase (ubiquinone) Fe-S protein 8
MASSRPVSVLARSSRATNAQLSSLHPFHRAAIAHFSTSLPRSATPAGPPPKGFRMPPPKKWDEGETGVFDKAGNWFLMSELWRGAYVVLEQYFRPPYEKRS